jgi:hypothetical protein
MLIRVLFYISTAGIAYSLFPQAFGTMSSILSATHKLFSPGIEGDAFRKDIVMKGTHPTSLPKAVLPVVEYFKENSVKDYQMSPEVLKNGQLLQRIPEGAWPVRVSNESPQYIRFVSEKIKPECQNAFTPSTNLPEDLAVDICPR